MVKVTECSARVFAQAQAMEDLGESTENIEIEARKAEKALNSVSISIRDANDPSSLRDMEDIMGDLATKWDGLSDATKNYVAEGVAGTNRKNFFITTMENYDRVLTLTNAGMKSQGELTKANEVRVNSLAGQTNIMNDKLMALRGQVEPLIVGGVELANVVLDVVTAFGAVPSVLTAIGIVLALTSEKFRTLGSYALASGIDLLGFNTKAKLASSEMKVMGVAMDLAKVKAIALQAVMSMGLSLAISATISVLASFISNTETASEKMEKARASADELSSSLKKVNSAEVDIKKYEQLHKDLKTVGEDEEERLSILKQIEEIENNSGTDFDGYSAILKDDNINLDTKLKLLEAIRQKELETQATTLKDSLLGTKKVDNEIKKIDEAMSQYSKWKKIISTQDSDGNVWLSPGVSMNISDASEEMKKLETVMKDGYVSIEENSSQWRLVGEVLGEDVIPNLSTLDEDTRKFILTLIGSNKAIDTNSDALDKNKDSIVSNKKALSELNSLLDDEKTENQNIVDLGQQLDDVKDLIEDINENGLNFDSMDKVLSLFDDFKGNITDASEVQEYLNGKMSDMEEAQRAAYTAMVENSNEYFETNIKNTSEWEQFTIDVNSNLTNLNSKMLNIMGDNYEKYFGDIADAYEIDLSNCKNIAEARIKIEAAAAEKIANMRQALVDAAIEEQNAINKSLQEQGIDGVTGAAVSPFGGTNGKSYRDAISEINSWKNEALGAINQIANVTIPSFSDLSSSKTDDKTSSDTEKEIEDLKNLADAYYAVNDAITDYDNAIKKNQLLQENATPTERVKLMKEELLLLKQQAKAYKDLENAQREQATITQNILKRNGFTFDDSGDISNYSKRIQSLTDWANSLSGDAKENAIESVEAIMNTVEEYIDLINTEIPKSEQTWLEYLNEIKQAERDRAEYITDLQDQIGDAITQRLEKETETLKKEINKQKDIMNDAWNEDDWNDQLTTENRKLDEINQQINNLKRDNSQAGKLKLQQLMAEYEAQRTAIDEMIKENERENANSRFDEALQDAEDKLEQALDPENLAQLVNQALTSGFVELDGQIYETENLLTNMLENSGEAFTALGTILKSELIDQLKTVQGLMGSIGAMQLSSASVTGRSATSQEITGRSAGQEVNVIFDAPLLSIDKLDGDVADGVLSRIQNAMIQVKDEITYEISKALQTI